MAKSKNTNKHVEDDDFQKFLMILPRDVRETMQALGIDSYDKMLSTAAILGLNDENVMDRLSQSLASYNDNLEDEDDDDYDEDDDTADYMDDEEEDEDDYLDMYRLPKQLIIPEEKAYEFHIRIKLNNAPVPVWREIKVPSNITIAFLSFILLDVMGWENCHLHLFRSGDVIYKRAACIRQDKAMGYFFSNRNVILPSEDYSISELFVKEKARIKFEYDFGDSWEHDVWLKGVRSYESDEKPRLILHKGVGSCPPEDCGGVWGYADLLHIKDKKRKTEEEKDRLKWYFIDKNFDPNAFEVDEIQYYLDDMWESLEEDGKLPLSSHE